MAAIQIEADKVIESCEKFLEGAKDGWLPKRYRTGMLNDHIDGIKATYAVDKIKKLAEYANKNAKQVAPRTYEIARITIDHNDFELIGEFL
jgi:hypothetical protein